MTTRPILEEGGVVVRAAVYPHPDYEAKLWSQWGQGLVLDDGRFLSAIGDHEGVDGNAFLYEYDPATATLTQIADVLSLVDHQPGAWGFGKVHAQLVPGPCGEVYGSTYWGTRRGIEFGNGYRGDYLLRLDPEVRTATALDVILEGHGVPSLAGSAAHGLVYAEATDPLQQEERNAGPFLAIDPAGGEIVFQDDDPAHAGYRFIAVDADGRAYYSLDGGRLAVYDPASGARTVLDDPIPGASLRAATASAPDGTVYGVTVRPEVFFALRPGGEVEPLGEARGYTTSLALDPEGGRFLHIPGSHGDSWTQGTPLIAVDGATGDQEVLVELNPAAERELGLRLGGTYGIAYDPEARRVLASMNAAPPTEREAFGVVVLLDIQLP